MGAEAQQGVQRPRERPLQRSGLQAQPIARRAPPPPSRGGRRVRAGGRPRAVV